MGAVEQKTIREILYEFVLEYAFHPERRSIAPYSQTCLYRGPKGARCAFAFFCEGLATFTEGMGAFEVSDGKQHNDESCLRPEYKGHTPDFWKALQALHDFGCNWDKEGLSLEGRLRLKRIEQQYAEPLEEA
jgi:hypothetical protein